MNDNLLVAARNAVKAEDWVNAWHLLNKELNQHPDRPEALYLMGHVLRMQGNPGIALPLLAKALSRDQKVPNLWMSYGACLHDLNHWDEAIKAFQVVEKMCPDDAMPPANMAGSIVNMGKWHEAINLADKALKRDPQNYIAKIAKTFGCLGLGRWKDAWESAEYLYGYHLDVRVYRDPEEPEWDGSKGKTVVVQCDQGLGDIIMFAQLIPRMQKDCKEVILETVPRLVNLLKRSFPGVSVYPTLKERGFDWPEKHGVNAHIHISYVPKFYLNKDSDFERKAYLIPDWNRVNKWLRWLEQFPKPWNGIAWVGGIQNTQTHIRSIELEELGPILDKPGTFFDLSYQDNGLEVARWNIDHKTQIVNPGIDVSDYDDTVALIQALDRIVTVTTTVAHVCGALGKKAHVLVPEVAQWRYSYRFGDGTSLIWYPEDSVRMYRQKPGENGWEHAINRVAKDL